MLAMSVGLGQVMAQEHNVAMWVLKLNLICSVPTCCRLVCFCHYIAM